ncbi:MAG: 3-oxoacyl-[acyl-carrier-protein] reductase [Paludibacteraceae bacterium]|nr:3-oxoacyl-[acyl-carrier-protein] reductase [Paludibacteraceae bacterium]MBO5014086.1 3-oxoacyl-[acyl-carrier-protein] reductase [Paludibacteraceae bacterium]MBP3576270.1 3-oxoacyl-[acyl-carrier-protein] reductase [Paludibacteraceae bacterium]
MNLLEGKTALITGGTRGIGKAIVLAMAEEGADIVFTYLSRSELAVQVVAEVEAMGRKCIAIQADASDTSVAQQVVNQAIEQMGHLDILVNNAGVTHDGLLIRMDEAQWDEVLNANLKSAFNYSKHVSQHMLSRRSGSIINLSSVVGIFGNAGQCNYAASKGAINAFTKSLSKELGARGVRVNGIAPGFILTEMTEALPQEVREQWVKDIALRRCGTPQDVANVAVFLASDMASYITGEIINCSGNIKS